MDPKAAHVLTCDTETDLLAVLADKVMNGSLLPAARDVPLFRWRIFLPTRRSVRRLEQLFFVHNGNRPLALPVIKPIGDIDDDVIETSHHVPAAISRHGLLFEVMSLVADWALRNPQFAIARDITGSLMRVRHLAESLVELLHQAETEERPFDGIDAVYERDLAGHREAILDLLGILKTSLPQRLGAQKLIGPSDRRNRLIRLQATDIRQRPGLHPVIIAGSTGTNPATRDLMAAVAFDPLGCVVLPGLDRGLADADWLQLAPTHPQSNLRAVLQDLAVARSEVSETGGGAARMWLAREIMRPTETSEPWHATLAGKATEMRAALTGVSLLEAPDRHIEARAIALVLRQAVYEGQKSIALITPDRDLAMRVKTELRRWAIRVDDTRGEALTATGQAQLLVLLADLLLSDFSSRALVAVLHDRLASFGMGDETCLRAKQLLDMHVLRQQGLALAGSDGLDHALRRAALERVHTAIPNDDDWQLIVELTARMRAAFAALASRAVVPLGLHMAALQECLELVTGRIALPPALETAFIALSVDDHRLPEMTCSDAVAIIVAQLASVTVRPAPQTGSVAIYGLLEARLMQCDVAVLGGLNETVWPASPDPGPWLNRPMRETFGLQQPERDIGLTAHDFVSGLGHKRVYLSWSKRIGMEPVIASRWMLRLRAVMEAGGIESKLHCDPNPIALALAIDKAQDFQPGAKPWPQPPVHLRPRAFSVTEIERLVRDPYAVYARRMLRLRPLDRIGQEPDARLRGTLIHAALKQWNELRPSGATPAPLAALLDAGARSFAPLADDPDVTGFWWPGFQRMATWLFEQETGYRADLQLIHAETTGILDFPVAGETFTLKAIADRIDILADGRARLIDYKTGQLPSLPQVKCGFSPQLTLEAAMLARGAFTKAGERTAAQAHYIKISGGRETGTILAIEAGDIEFAALTALHWAGLQKRLAALLQPETAFPPRIKLQFEERGSDYDHLSRFQEWSLAQ